MKILLPVLKRKFRFFDYIHFEILNLFSFMVELIKSKQDNVITKGLIRSRQLDQSMLRFTRYYRDQDGVYQQDIDSQEYSCIMTESKNEQQQRYLIEN